MTKLLEQMEAEADDRVAYLALSMSLRRRVAKVSHNAPLQSLYLTLVAYLEESLDRLASGGLDVQADLVSARAVVASVADGVAAAASWLRPRSARRASRGSSPAARPAAGRTACRRAGRSRSAP